MQISPSNEQPKHRSLRKSSLNVSFYLFLLESVATAAAMPSWRQTSAFLCGLNTGSTPCCFPFLTARIFGIEPGRRTPALQNLTCFAISLSVSQCSSSPSSFCPKSPDYVSVFSRNRLIQLGNLDQLSGFLEDSTVCL